MTGKPAAKGKTKAAKKPQSKPRKVYLAVREIESVNRSYTEPDLVFATKAAAQAHADRLNRELRELTNPFADGRELDDLIDGDPDELLKSLGLPRPKARGWIDWAAWWDRTVPNLTPAQRDAVWDALDEFEWYKVAEAALEG